MIKVLYRYTEYIEFKDISKEEVINIIKNNDTRHNLYDTKIMPTRREMKLVNCIRLEDSITYIIFEIIIKCEHDKLDLIVDLIRNELNNICEPNENKRFMYKLNAEHSIDFITRLEDILFNLEHKPKSARN